MKFTRPSRKSLIQFANYYFVATVRFILGIVIGSAITRSGCDCTGPKNYIKARAALAPLPTVFPVTSPILEPIKIEPQKGKGGSSGGGGEGGGGEISAAGKVKAGDPLALVLGAALMGVVASDL